MKNNQKGFTLVELLVVIAIIGILASVVLISLNSARGKARDARRVSDMHQISLALENYYDANQVYPAVLSSLVSTYLTTVPKDPQTGDDYKYAGLGSGATCSNYHLGAILENTTATGLASDADAAAGTKCTGSNDDFGGNTTDCAAGAGTELCYDVKP